MTLHWADFALILAIVVAGCGMSYFLVAGRLRRMLAENQREMERRLAAQTEALAMRAPVSSDTVPATDAMTATEIEIEAAPGSSGPVQEPAGVRETPLPTVAAEQEDAEIPSEIEVIIAAAAIAAFGNHARVRSARRVPSSDVVSPWTQQGRVIVQSSHNLWTRG